MTSPLIPDNGVLLGGDISHWNNVIQGDLAAFQLFFFLSEYLAEFIMRGLGALCILDT